ncbi:MAG: chromosome segregation protein SMC [Holophagaceae bacterium]|nr:chromosome segregation protein SMC [Holophagaceae bacterium]
MRLISLEINGFKSFADTQKLIFPGGLTAVVGPNGCGKSNISDALAWVLGEQRVSLMRGTEMADVVFAGTSERRPTAMAEVKLVLEMPDHSRPDVANEITVSRRLFRDSGSEYKINGHDCRLKDIQDLLMDTGMGTRAYSFIQQGQIDQILSTKPKDRRQLLEEAAGITKYKVRRAETERRLEETRANLQRLDDILFEKGKQQDSLRRQAAKTRRAKELDNKIRDTKRILLTGKALDFVVAREQVDLNLDDLESRTVELTSQVAEKASEVEGQNLALTKLRDGHAKQIKKIDEIDRERGLLTQSSGFEKDKHDSAELDIKQTKQRLIDLNSQTGDWTSELDELAKKLTKAQQALEEQEVQYKNAEERVALAVGALRSVESDLKDLRGKRDEAILTAAQKQRDRQVIIGEIARLEGRLVTLNDEEVSRAPALDGLREKSRRIARELEGAEERFSEIEEATTVQAGVRSDANESLAACEREWRETEGNLNATELQIRQLSDALKTAQSASDFEESIKWLGERGITPTSLVDSLEIDDEARPDLERVLGSWIQTVSWKIDSQTLKQLPGQLMVSTDSDKTSVVQPPHTVSLFESIRWKKKTPKVLAGLLVRVFRCSDEKFKGLVDAHPDMAFISPSFIKLPFGPILVGIEPPVASPIKIKAELDGSKAEREVLLDKLEACEALKKTLTHNAGEAQERLREMEDDRSSAKRLLEDLAGQQKSVQSQIKEIETAQQRADVQWETFELEKAKLSEQINEIDKGQPSSDEDAINKEILCTEQKLSEAQHCLEERREFQVESHAKKAIAWSERDSVDQQLQHKKRAAFNSEAEKKRLCDELQQAEGRKESSINRMAEIERAIQGFLVERDKSSKALADFQKKITVSEENLRLLEIGDRELQEALKNAWELYTDAKVKDAEIRGNRDTIAKEIELALELSLPDFLNSITAEEKEAWEQGGLVHETRLSELENRRQDLGSVNPFAIEELEEVENELNYKNEQRADVLESITDLETAIKDYNSTSEERFREAFDFINIKFQEVFRQVFGGGSAHLSLQDPKDILECGIEITAQPPGKTAKVLSLLSGGEKALTAISLLFAIFHFKPSPFCVLDEVDAPLDEANVARFADLVNSMKGNTQFIVITHQKPTMIAADTLYGVTMEEKGISRLVSVQLKEAEALI